MQVTAASSSLSVAVKIHQQSIVNQYGQRIYGGSDKTFSVFFGSPLNSRQFYI